MIQDGVPATAANFNAAYLSKTQNGTTVGVVSLNNTLDPNSGDQIVNTQQAINELFDADGTNGEGDAARKNYGSNNYITDGSSRKTAIEQLDTALGVLADNSLTGPVSSTNNGVATFAGIDGDILLSTPVTIDNLGNMVVPGDFTVNGTTTTINTVNLEVTDQNITVNNGGTDFTAEGAGVTVERSGTYGSIAYEAALVSRFKCGDLGSEAEILTASDAQIITNKDIDGGTASNARRITVPSDTYANLLALTRKAGALVFGTDTLKFYYDNGSTLVEPTGSFSWATEVDTNIIPDNDDYYDLGSNTRHFTQLHVGTISSALNAALVVEGKAGLFLDPNADGVGDEPLNIEGNTQIRDAKSLRLMDLDSSNYVALKSADVLAGNTTWTLPSVDGAANDQLATNGSGTLYWAAPPVASGASTALDNLASVAINTDLTFGTGVSGLLKTKNETGVAQPIEIASGSSSSNSSGYVFIQSGSGNLNTGNAIFATGSAATGNSGSVIIRSGTGEVSGDITLQVGTAGTTPGKIYFNDGSQGLNKVWTDVTGSGGGEWVTPSGSGTVTSVAMSVPSFLSVSGSPVTSSGTLAVSLSGTALPLLNGGTGATTQVAAANNILPSQATNSGKFLTTNGTDASWATVSGTAPAGANKSIQYNNSGAFGGSTISYDSGADSVSFHGSTASGGNSFASGSTTTASGQRSSSFGTNSQATAQSAFAIGNATIASGLNSFAGGEGATAQGFSQVALGRFNVLQGTSGSSVSTDQTLVIGNGTSGASRSNAFAFTRDAKFLMYGTTSGNLTQSASPTTTSYSLVWPATQGAPSTVLQNDGSGVLSWVGTAPVWTKYTVSHTAFQTAALTNNVQLFSLPAKGVIHNVIISHSTQFTGTGISTYTVSVGIASSLSKYASAFTVSQVPGDSVGQSSVSTDFENKASATSIRIAATSTGANLSQSTAGSVDVWVYASVLP